MIKYYYILKKEDVFKMVYRDYICDACGFTTEEEPGVYKCPKCGTQMRAAKNTRYGDNTASYGRWVIYILEIIFLLPLCFVFLGGIPGIIVFIIIFFVVRRILTKGTRNNAIKTIPAGSVKNPNQTYKCNTCGHSFKGQQHKCPKCGVTLRYEN